MKWPTKKQWEAGVRPCMKCSKLMKRGTYNTFPTPPEYLGQRWDWAHKVQVLCRAGYFHCGGDKCDHTAKDRNGMMFLCIPKVGWIFRPATGKDALKSSQ